MGTATALLRPLVDAIRHHVLFVTKLHADDTPVPALTPGNGKAKTGRLWTYCAIIGLPATARRQQ